MSVQATGLSVPAHAGIGVGVGVGVAVGTEVGVGVGVEFFAVRGPDGGLAFDCELSVNAIAVPSIDAARIMVTIANIFCFLLNPTIRFLT
ncbi:MAG: hypothetical protein ABSD92_13430 [Candidatus Bathyarchaeia archaeon]